MYSVQAKLGRADEHLREIEAALTGLDERARHRVLLSRRTGTDANVVDLSEHPPADPTRVPILVGGVLHQLRSALDHCVAALGRKNGFQQDSESEFPIFWDEGRFKKESTKRIKGVSTAVAEVIRAHQPFHWRAPRFKDHPLWILHDLNNADKHRVLIGTGSTLQVDNLDLNLAPGTRREVVLAIPEGQRLSTSVSTATTEGAERWTLNATFSKFGQTVGHPIIPGLVLIRRYVATVIDECDRAS